MRGRGGVKGSKRGGRERGRGRSEVGCVNKCHWREMARYRVKGEKLTASYRVCSRENAAYSSKGLRVELM